MPTATISPISDDHSRYQFTTHPVVRSESIEAERLGDQITELCSYLHAAEARLLTLIREFDTKECWAELSYFKVRAMTRIADAGNEDYLLMIARHGTAHHVEKLVTRYRSAKRAQDAALAAEQYRDRELNHYCDHDGCLVIKARMPAER